MHGKVKKRLQLLKNFGQLSGFTIHWETSLFVPVSDVLDCLSKQFTILSFYRVVCVSWDFHVEEPNTSF